MIKTVDLRKAYKDGEVETTALSGINIDICPGEMVAITGPSGCGKSTLLNILGMIDKPDGGEYYFNGEPIAAYTERQRTNLRKNNIGFIFQNFNLVNELTVFGNVELPLLYTGMSTKDRSKTVDVLLDQMKMSHRRNHYPQQLSGGQQQRVAVARAIINQPKVILADEPTGNLDTKHGDEVLKLLLELNEAGTTIIMVTHSPYYAQYCRRTIKLLDGKVVTEQKKSEFYV